MFSTQADHFIYYMKQLNEENIDDILIIRLQVCSLV